MRGSLEREAPSATLALALALALTPTLALALTLTLTLTRYDAARRRYHVCYADGDRKWHELDDPG